MTKVIHIVIVKFKPEVTEEVKERVGSEIRALKDKIPEIISATAGKNFTDRSQGFEYGWVVEVKDKNGLSVYNDHPAHLEFVSKNKPLIADLLAFDYEV
ncbi:hypothetical protein G6F70_006926 [Rhizopus microsporus]|uniref:Stress-response A/B barrel domain-containing protein n=2 Tax=Rhizopus TaxID=4842 RepID=A0A367JQ11_RHIAZ|nr:hypothetical protein G6F71_007629 [Rhizopus microsporus]RCH91975.1 hypothetical protein CU097_009022 [Rhizopus azygosporus]KAG1197071.1 hypothetical protein G6F70_006926 [Rhizopus microsporus]KAG1207875.1 hypothetical protein G6F69_007688 [Rhizopus microsporus]KAG1228753.1 hypothetical protein G6F67_007620 [Rhizopus microsporus]